MTWVAPPGPPPLPVSTPPWRIRAVENHGRDLDRLVRWMHAAHVEAYWHHAWPAQQWAAALDRQRTGDHSLPCVAETYDEPVAYLELYRVCRDRIHGLYPDDQHDLGVHIAIGDTGHTGRGLGRSLLRAVADGLLAADPACRRVVAEPDVRNEPSLRAFTAAGFRRCGEIELPEKTAALLVRPRTEEDLP
ncbi:MAG TPA: GNAT family N-acetyltransferase [Pseudonocardiaceae bacterium]|jgi:RimJ/RimL family protein N-acetyltransferase